VELRSRRPVRSTLRRCASYAMYLARWVWAGLLGATGCLEFVKRRFCTEGAIVVLTFHRVLRPDQRRVSNSGSGMAVDERTFAELTAYIAQAYRPTALECASPRELSDRVRVVLTFDDGWVDNATVVFPIVARHAVPITIFVCPAVVGKTAPFWPERVAALMKMRHDRADESKISAVVEQLKGLSPIAREQFITKLSEGCAHSPELHSIDATMSWLQITALHCAGVSFGSHTSTHQILTRVPAEVARWEVSNSKQEIETALRSACGVLAYPNGNCSPEVRSIVAQAGFRRAVVTKRAAWTADSDPLAIPRLTVYQDEIVGPSGRFSPHLFEYMAFWKIRGTYRASAVHAQQRAPMSDATLSPSTRR
jgi:peptidoglycan/xylan/chitin deacetylase (PgdA/CDA1 family)